MLQYTRMEAPKLNHTDFEPPGYEEHIKLDHQSFILQVILPFVLGFALLAVMFVLIWRSGVGTASAWADTASIFIALPLLCAGLFPLAAVIALWFGTFKLTAWLPGPLRSASQLIRRAGRIIRQGTDAAVKPMFAIQGAWAVVVAFFTGLASLLGLANGESHE